MSKEKIRLLLSARDVAAALAIINIVKIAQNDPRYEINVVASDPAFTILRKEILVVHFFANTPIDPWGKADNDVLLHNAGKLIDEVDPHAILVGLSGPSPGIDEALLAKAGNRPTYAIQDFWGDVNLELGKPASTYFVIDEEASQITHSKTSTQTIVTGSVKHVGYNALDVLQLRGETRASLGIGPEKKLIGFFGQPLWAFDNYEEILLKLGASANRVYDEKMLIFKPSPIETPIQHKKAIKLLSAGGGKFFVNTLFPVESTLAACDIVINCCSTCGLDQIMLNGLAPYPIGMVVYLLPEPLMNSWYRPRNGFNFLPKVLQEVGLWVKDLNSLDEFLVTAGEVEKKQSSWLKACKLTQVSTKAGDIILNTIANDLS